MHLAQHKGQLIYYLKLMAKSLGTRHLWGSWAHGPVRMGAENRFPWPAGRD